MSGILYFFPAASPDGGYFLFRGHKQFRPDRLLDFNTVGQYTNNFNVWQDNNGVNGGAYAFTENTTDGVA